MSESQLTSRRMVCGRDGEMRGEIVDSHVAVALYPVEQFLLSSIQRDAWVSGHVDEKCLASVVTVAVL